MFRERQELDDKLQELKFLSPMEESRMVELDESIEAVDAAIDYKNDVLLGVSLNLIICSEIHKIGIKKRHKSNFKFFWYCYKEIIFTSSLIIY